MRKIAIVCPRYGIEIRDKEVRFARMLAENLMQRYEVEVLTTRALDSSTWRNWYAREYETVKGVNVHRFKVTHEKAADFNSYTSTYLQQCREGAKSVGVESLWIEKHGPQSPDCIRHLMFHRFDYDAVIFVGHMNYLTVAGIPEVRDRAILIPLIDGNQPYFQFTIMQKMFAMANGFIFLSDEERMFVRQKFRTQGIPCEVMGASVDIPDNVNASDFYRKYRINDFYLAYSGRVDESKSCDLMFDYFCEYKARNPQSPLKLLLMGKVYCEVPERDDIISLGDIPESDRLNGIAGAGVFVYPARHEAIPESVMSAMALGVPVLVSGGSEAMKNLCIKSNAGLFCNNFFEFEGALNLMLSREDVYEAMSRNAIAYTKQTSQWDTAVEKFVKLFTKPRIPGI